MTGPARAGQDAPLVSIVVPCRNERAFIGKCLDSILASQYPAARLEVMVVDGMSDDGTRDLVSDYARRDPRMCMLDNPARHTPAALNIGVRSARGEVVMRMDAHTEYPSHYISELVRHLLDSGADNVGGVCATRPGSNSPKAKAIALALSHPFGVGNSYFRIGVREPRWVDTVPFGCYRREVFERIGGFDEGLLRNQDDEFNARLIRHGGKILLVPGVVSTYYARDALRKLWRMYYQYGYFKPLAARKVGRVMTMRQLVPSAFVLAVGLAGLSAPWVEVSRIALSMIGGVYVAATAAVSLSLGRAHGLRCVAALTLTFPALHLSYGIGFLHGAVDCMVGRRMAGRTVSAPITR